MKSHPRSSPAVLRLLKYLCLGAGALGMLAACERSPLAATPAAPEALPATAPDAAGVEHNVRAYLAAQDRITEQQLANRRALADVRGVGAQMQERLQRETLARTGEAKHAKTADSGESMLLVQAQNPSPAPTAVPQPAPSASATVAPKTDPKFQKPPTEDESDSMKPDPARTKPSPSPTPTPKDNARKTDDKAGSASAKSSASPSAAPGKP